MYRKTVLILFFLLIDFSIYAEELRDPTQLPNIDFKQLANDTNFNNFLIKGIIISPTQKLVFIGDRQLTIGDEVSGGKIADIQQDSIKIKSKNNEVIAISMFNTILKEANNKDGDKP